MRYKDITVIIPTYNRAKELVLTLPSYIENKNVREIIVVNDGSTDETGDIIQSFRENSRLLREIKNNKKLGQPKARRVGISEADTEYILFGEDDVYLSSDYINILYKQLKEFSCDIISGKLINVRIDSQYKIKDYINNINIQNFIGFPQDFKPFKLSEKTLDIGVPIEVPFTHAIVLTKKSICNNVVFDSFYTFGNSYREDTDFFLSARKYGAKILFTPDTSCYHMRGSLGQSGGQRINRLFVEFLSIYNTWYMLKKHWNILSDDFELKHGPLFNTLIYLIHREYGYLSRAMKGKY